MEFIRVNDNMVKCLINEEDMDRYDVSIEDFFNRSDNAMEFLHEIVKQASEEVGYKPQGPLTSLQIAPVDENSLAIFLTERTQFDLQALLKGLKKTTGVEIPEDIMDQVEQATSDEQVEYFTRLMENIHKEIQKNLQENHILDEVLQSDKDGNRHIVSLERKIFAFERPADLLQYAKSVILPKDIKSSLYKDDDHDTYYMIVERNEVDVETLSGVYLTAYEYGHFVSEKAEIASFIREHCDCLIEEDAIGKLKG